ncbi:MAG TPA: hypothetical protein P5277_02635 [Candidatus Paceibacterota bacterium]|nr:hypothetical protein [Candidatus Paceibacterota bacterium]
MNINDALNKFNSETNLELRLGSEYVLYDGIIGAEIFKDRTLYGKMIFGANHQGQLIKCIYEGFYPGAEKAIHLELASLKTRTSEPLTIRRLDVNRVTFLGYPQDGWFEKNQKLREQLRSRGKEYIQKLKIISKTECSK